MSSPFKQSLAGWLDDLWGALTGRPHYRVRAQIPFVVDPTSPHSTHLQVIENNITLAEQLYRVLSRRARAWGLVTEVARARVHPSTGNLEGTTVTSWTAVSFKVAPRDEVELQNMRDDAKSALAGVTLTIHKS